MADPNRGCSTADIALDYSSAPVGVYPASHLRALQQTWCPTNVAGERYILGGTKEEVNIAKKPKATIPETLLQKLVSCILSAFPGSVRDKQKKTGTVEGVGPFQGPYVRLPAPAAAAAGE